MSDTLKYDDCSGGWQPPLSKEERIAHLERELAEWKARAEAAEQVIRETVQDQINAAQAAQNAAGQASPSVAAADSESSSAVAPAPAAPDADAQAAPITHRQPDPADTSAGPASSALVAIANKWCPESPLRCLSAIEEAMFAAAPASGHVHAQDAQNWGHCVYCGERIEPSAPASGPSEEAVKVAKLLTMTNWKPASDAEGAALMLAHEILRLHGGKP